MCSTAGPGRCGRTIAKSGDFIAIVQCLNQSSDGKTAFIFIRTVRLDSNNVSNEGLRGDNESPTDSSAAWAKAVWTASAACGTSRDVPDPDSRARASYASRMSLLRRSRSAGDRPDPGVSLAKATLLAAGVAGVLSASRRRLDADEGVGGTLAKVSLRVICVKLLVSVVVVACAGNWGSLSSHTACSFDVRILKI